MLILIFRLHGQVKYDDMVLDINLPAKVSGQLAAPKISLSSSLLELMAVFRKHWFLMKLDYHLQEHR